MATSTELVPIGDSHLPDLQHTAILISELVDALAAEPLAEARIRAQAYELYERRNENTKRAHHFWTISILAEAGLGCISFSKPEIVEGSKSYVNDCRVLASAFERGHLADRCREHPVGRGIVHSLRGLGYHYVPVAALGVDAKSIKSMSWRGARRIALEKGIPLTELPPDEGYVKRADARYRERLKRQQRQLDAYERLQRMKRSGRIGQAAKDHSQDMGNAYGYLRKALQSLHDAQTSMTRYERAGLDDLFWLLYRAEDELGELLRVPS